MSMELSKLECLLSRLGFRCRTLDLRQCMNRDSRTSGGWLPGMLRCSKEEESGRVHFNLAGH